MLIRLGIAALRHELADGYEYEFIEAILQAPMSTGTSLEPRGKPLKINKCPRKGSTAFLCLVTPFTHSIIQRIFQRFETQSPTWTTIFQRRVHLMQLWGSQGGQCLPLHTY